MWLTMGMNIGSRYIRHSEGVIVKLIIYTYLKGKKRIKMIHGQRPIEKLSL